MSAGLRQRPAVDRLTSMTMPELKNEIAALSEDERYEVQAFLLHLARVNDPEHRRRLAEEIDRMDQGDKVSLDQFIRDNLAPENGEVAR